MNRKSCVAIASMLVLAGLGFVATAFADTQIARCRDIAAKDSQKAIVQCDLRATEDVVVSGVKVTADGRSVDATYKPNSAAEPPAAVLFLLDQSIQRDFDRLLDAASEIIDPNVKGVTFGVYGFTRDLQAIAPLGTSPRTIKLALGSVDRRPLAAELLKNILDALPMLSSAPGERKIMVVFSDGNIQDKAYSVPEVSAKLKEANVVLIGIAPGISPDDVTKAQSLRRLSQESSGEFLTLRNATVTNSSVARVKSLVAKGGLISFEPIAGEMKIEVNIEGGKPVILSYKTALPPSVDAAPGSELDVKPVNYANPREVYDAFRTWLQASTQNQLIFGGGVLAAVVMLVLIGVVTSRRRQREAEEAFAEATAAAQAPVEIKPVFGWLEFLDGNQTREPIRSRATRIGRSSDNDIVLKNTSVHRQHAVIREDPAGGFVIVDMDTANGIKVNQEWVKSAKLKQGDVIELGEVRMRFTQPHSNS